MALDEVRATFSLVRPQHAADIAEMERARADKSYTRKPNRHYELWFRGVHSNIGGGYFDRGLSDISLAWMIEMYVWTLHKEGGGKPPDRLLEALRLLEPKCATPAPASTDADDGLPWAGTLETLEPNCDGELGRPADVRHQRWREVPPKALIHHSVFRRSTNLLLDHSRANRRLLRQIPGDAQPVYDPPFFYSDTPREAAKRIAEAAYSHVPVRASSWLMVHGEAVFRSDSWIAIGQDRNTWTAHTTRRAFVTIATEWLLQGKPPAPPDGLPETFTDTKKTEVKSIVVATWVIEVLAALEPYVLALREHAAGSRLPASGSGQRPGSGSPEPTQS